METLKTNNEGKITHPTAGRRMPWEHLPKGLVALFANITGYILQEKGAYPDLQQFFHVLTSSY